MTEEEKKQIIEQVLVRFDFKKIACLEILFDEREPFMQRMISLHKSAEKLLRMALDHEDEDFWWAGGIGHGGLCAWWDKKRGLSLNYIIEASKLNLKHQQQ